MQLTPTKQLLGLLITSCLGLTGCGHLNENTETDRDAVLASIELQNPSLFEREKQAIYVSFYDLGLTQASAKSINISVLNGQHPIASQKIDDNFDGVNDGILFLSDFAASATQHFDIIQSSIIPKTSQPKLTQAEISIKENGTWVEHSKQKNSAYQEYIGGEFRNVNTVSPPAQYTDHSNWIRYEGPGIESDKVGYRIYLDWRNGFDIFGKLVSEPVLQQVGLDGYESYHHKEKWGMDILKVGKTLGAGGFGLWNDDKLSLISDSEQLTATINENGELRSAFSIDYQGWQSEIGKQDFSAHFSMLGGSRLVKVDLDLSKPVSTMATGVVKHPDTTFIQGNMDITGKAYTYIASWGKQSLDGANLGMAVFFRKQDLAKVTQDEGNYIAVLAPNGNPTELNPDAHELHYYFAAVWQPESDITTQAQFIDYLDKEAEKLTIAPRQRLKTKLSQSQQSKELSAQTALNWAEALADSELKRKTLSYQYDGWDVNRQRKPKFEYDIVGLNPMAYDALYQASGEQRYAKVLEQVSGSYIDESGDIRMYKLANYNIDSVAPGRAVLKLYQQTGQEKYKKAAALLREQLDGHPRTAEGAFWHKKIYPNQLWLDGVYMGMPFLAEYSAMFEQGHSFDEVVNEFALTRKYLRDPTSGLYYHGWDEAKQQTWANKQSGLSPMFWGRGVGWLAMALVDVLDYIPQDKTPQRQVLIDMVNELAETLVNYQDPETGTWWQIMDMPYKTGNYRESSASAMFSYFFSKALNNGYLNESYLTVAKKAYSGLISEFTLVHADGSTSMTNQCYVAGLGFGRNGSYHYYMTEPVVNNDLKGNFAYILASIEMAKLLK